MDTKTSCFMKNWRTSWHTKFRTVYLFRRRKECSYSIGLILESIFIRSGFTVFINQTPALCRHTLRENIKLGSVLLHPDFKYERLNQVDYIFL